MARTSGSGNRTGELYFLQIAGLKENKVYFKQAKAVEGAGVEQIEDKTMREISGRIDDIEFETETFEGETKDVVILWLSDNVAKETYRTKLSFTNVGRSIFNSLLGIQAPAGNLSIALYNRSKDGFAAAAVKHNGAQASWKHSIDELSKYITKVQKKKKVDGKMTTVDEKDYADLNEFLLGELKTWAATAIVKSARPAPEDAPKSSDPGAAKSEDGDDLPF